MIRARTSKTRAILQDPLEAVPFIPDTVELREDSEGNLQMRTTPPMKGLRARAANWLGQDQSTKVALDEHGTFFIRQIDGEKDLNEIVDAMVTQSGRSREDVEAGVILYTKKLMIKNMMALRVARE